MRWLAIVSFCVLSLKTCFSVRSGLYVDNGFDQTIMHHELSKYEKQEMETELLNILGLPNRPPKRRRGGAPLEKSATKFMMEIYKSLMERENSPNRVTRDADVTHQDLNIVDAVMTFQSHDKRVSGVRHERGKRLWFDVSEVPAGETIMSAELHVFQEADNDTETEQYTLAAYQVVYADNGERELELVSSVNTTNTFTGWLELNMTGPMVTWVAFPHSNHGIYLSVHPVNKPGHEVKPEEIGLVSTHGDAAKQPFLAAYFQASSNKPGGGARRRRTRGADRRRKAEYSTPNSYYPRMDRDSPLTRNCQIQTLYVSFKELQWQDWIIAPPGFEAYYCTGECSFPLNAHMNATNHAIVQALVHLMNPTHVPKPCCAPTKLSAISVLYFLDDTEVVLKKYRNIVVKSCGCH